MTDVLIIRSVGLQQLDLLLPRLAAEFTGQRLILLTHPHSLEAVSKYPELAEVLVYPHRGSYQPWRRVVSLDRRRFDRVIVPVSSLEGGGFFNVLAFAATLPTRQLLLCRPDGELEPLTRTALLRQFGMRLVAAVAAGLAALLLAPLLLVLPLWLWWLRQGAPEDV